MGKLDQTEDMSIIFDYFIYNNLITVMFSEYVWTYWASTRWNRRARDVQLESAWIFHVETIAKKEENLIRFSVFYCKHNHTIEWRWDGKGQA